MPGLDAGVHDHPASAVRLTERTVFGQRVPWSERDLSNLARELVVERLAGDLQCRDGDIGRDVLGPDFAGILDRCLILTDEELELDLVGQRQPAVQVGSPIQFGVRIGYLADRRG